MLAHDPDDSEVEDSEALDSEAEAVDSEAEDSNEAVESEAVDSEAEAVDSEAEAVDSEAEAVDSEAEDSIELLDPIGPPLWDSVIRRNKHSHTRQRATLNAVMVLRSWKQL